MSTPKLQHYIPQMILRRFADQNGLLYCYSCADPQRPVWVSKTANVFAENHLYTLLNDDDEADVSIEKEFSALEGRVSVIIDRIVEAALTKQIPQLRGDEREIWLQFLVLQQRRVPDVSRPVVEAKVDRLIDEIPKKIEKDLGRRLTPDELAEFREPDNQKRLRKNAIAKFASTKPRHEFLKKLQDTYMITSVIQNPKKSFVCGSRPIAGFHNWFCVHQKVAVKLAPPPGLDQLVFFVTSSEIRQINQDIANRSTFFAGSSRRLVESLARPR